MQTTKSRPQTIFKQRYTKDFTPMPNVIFRQQRGTMRPSDTEIFLYLCSLPCDWEISTENVARFYQVSKKYVQKCFDLLIKRELMMAVPMRDEKGKYTGVMYQVFMPPEDPDNPDEGKIYIERKPPVMPGGVRRPPGKSDGKQPKAKEIRHDHPEVVPRPPATYYKQKTEQKDPPKGGVCFCREKPALDGADFFDVLGLSRTTDNFVLLRSLKKYLGEAKAASVIQAAAENENIEDMARYLWGIVKKHKHSGPDPSHEPESKSCQGQANKEEGVGLDFVVSVLDTSMRKKMSRNLCLALGKNISSRDELLKAVKTAFGPETKSPIKFLWDIIKDKRGDESNDDVKAVKYRGVEYPIGADGELYVEGKCFNRTQVRSMIEKGTLIV